MQPLTDQQLADMAYIDAIDGLDAMSQATLQVICWSYGGGSTPNQMRTWLKEQAAQAYNQPKP